jgi:hypothetical protein
MANIITASTVCFTYVIAGFGQAIIIWVRTRPEDQFMTQPRTEVGRFLSRHEKEIHVARFALSQDVPYLHRAENFQGARNKLSIRRGAGGRR